MRLSTTLRAEDIDLGAARIMLLMPVMDFGGVESRVVLQSELMKDRVGELRVCAMAKRGAAARRVEQLGVSMDVLDVDPSIRDWRTTWTLFRHIRRHKPDVLHCRIAEGNWHGLIAGALAGTPVRIAEEVGLPTRSRVGRAAYSALFRTAQAVVGISKSTVRYLVDQDAVPETLARLIYNTANPKFFRNAVPRSKCWARPFRVIAVGRLHEVKNHVMLIRAFGRLHQEHSHSELLIVGEGDNRSALERLIEELNLRECVKLLGFREDIQEQLRSADLFVLPSFSEGLPISLIEAMTCELPVLGADVGGVAEVMGDLGPQYLLEPTDEDGWVQAMGRAHQMAPAERARLGAHARRVVKEKFSPEAYTENLLGLYRGLLAARGGLPGKRTS